jgi:hypothetical protein
MYGPPQEEIELLNYNITAGIFSEQKQISLVIGE